MKLLNIGCGANRPTWPWVNVDHLHSFLKPGTPERDNLDAESNYTNWDISTGLPFVTGLFDGILCSHVIEHFDCTGAVDLIKECYRVLAPGGILVASVPDASYFLQVHSEDTRENSERLFGEPICPTELYHKSFFDYALFYHEHKQVLDSDTLTCLMIRGGFHLSGILNFEDSRSIYALNSDAFEAIASIMNRRKFSVELVGIKR